VESKSKVISRTPFFLRIDPIREMAECDPAMGDRNLLGFRNFREGPAVGRIQENRVVSEPAAPARRVGDRAFDNTCGLVNDLAVFDGCKRRDESSGSRPVALCIEPPVDFSESFRISGIGPNEASGLHARLAVKRVDDEAGILRDGPQPTAS